MFAAAGLDVAWLDQVAADLTGGGDQIRGDGQAAGGDQAGTAGRAGEPAPEAVAEAVRWLAYTLESEALLDEIEEAANRISTMVGAVKQYSHMDQAAHQEVDLHLGWRAPW